MDFVPLIKSTITTLNSKKNITPSMKQQALRFLFYCQDNVGDADEDSKQAIKDYEHYLRQKGVLMK